VKSIAKLCAARVYSGVELKEIGLPDDAKEFSGELLGWKPPTSSPPGERYQVSRWALALVFVRVGA